MFDDRDILGDVLEQLRGRDKVYPLDLHHDVDTTPHGINSERLSSDRLVLAVDLVAIEAHSQLCFDGESVVEAGHLIFVGPRQSPLRVRWRRVLLRQHIWRKVDKFR